MLEEPGRDRHQPLVTTLAVGDEDATLGHPQVLQPQPEHLAAAQPAQQHRGDHGPVPVGAQRPGEGVDLGRGQNPRQRASRGADQWHALGGAASLPTGGQTPRHRVRGDPPRAVKNANRPDTVDNRRRTVRSDTPDASAGAGPTSGSGRLVMPWRCAVMNPSTSIAVTTSTGLSTTVRNTLRSNHAASTEFGRQRPDRNSRYASNQRAPEPLGQTQVGRRNHTRQNTRHAGPPRGAADSPNLGAPMTTKDHPHIKHEREHQPSRRSGPQARSRSVCWPVNSAMSSKSLSRCSTVKPASSAMAAMSRSGIDGAR